MVLLIFVSHDGESVRWECVDGRWVALSLGETLVSTLVLRKRAERIQTLVARTSAEIAPNTEHDLHVKCLTSLLNLYLLPTPVTENARG